MAPPFKFPESLEALQDADDSSHLSLQTLTPVSSLSAADLEEFVKGVSFDLSDKELFSIEEQDLFDRVYSLVKAFSSLPSACKFNLTDSLRSNLSVLLPNVDSLLRRTSLNRNGNDEIGGSDDEENNESCVGDRVASHRNAFKIYTFFLVHIVLIEDTCNTTNPSKVAASSRKKQLVKSWNWELQRGRVLSLIANSLEINLSSLFGSSDPDENYLSFIVKNAFLLFENFALLKHSDSKEALCRIVGTCATKYHYVSQACASILHLIHKHDYVVIPLADAVSVAEKKYSDGSLATSLVREVGRTNPKAYVKDIVGSENIGRFLVEVADRMPKLISTNIGLLVPHFCGESYKIRNALVGVLGKLVVKSFNDVEGEISSKSIRLRTKQAMLEILLERCRDVSAYTRSRVLQVWAELCEENSVSIGMWNEVASVATGRLEDKSAIVRKSALNLLIMMLQHNPFGPQLRGASFQATLEQYRKKLLELEPKDQTKSELDGISSDNENFCGDGEVDYEVNEDITKKHDDSLPDSLVNEEGLDCSGNCVPDFGNLEQTRTLVASLEAGLRFSNCLSAVMPTLVQLMSSSSATDVENTILLLMRCRQFQIDGSADCLKKMLPLVFSQDKTIHEAVENAFITIYIGKNPIESAKNLINLAVDSNIGDLAALESIVAALVTKGDITSATISALWDFFCFNINGTKAEHSRGALSILCMAAKSYSVVLSAHLQDIVDIGFGRWAKVDPLLARTACIALQRLSDEDRKRLLSSNGGRLFDILESLIIGPGLPDKMWYSAAEKAIATLYALHPTPETIAADLVKRSLNSVFRNSQTKELQDDIDNIDCSLITTVPATRLSRYLFVVSHVAMNQLVYIESSLREIQKERRQKENIGVDSVKSNTKETSTDFQKDSGINAELGVAASEDAVIDSLSEKAEKEIISGGSAEKNLIGQCASFLSKLCRNLNLMKKYPELQASGMLALCQFMIIDADFCAANLQLLFTVVEGSPSDTVRSNCTIALGDLAVRFPNLLEPWTENMYARLRDPSATVRKNAVLVLSHLILNDMMKVKGYINEMTICLEDEDERISSLAKLFFNELSKKGANPIYNLLPDILGRLSSQNLKQEAFCNIMQFLIGSIKKDKQMESLVEKLCNRFSGVSDGKQWEYISYCLSQLAFTEKSMRKLIESFKTYEHVLSNGSVMDHFRNIITKAKKFAKPELKSCIEEFEEKINRFHIEKRDQEVTAQNAQAHQQKVDSLEGIVAAKRDGDSEESNIAEEGKDGEVTDMSTSDMSEVSETRSEVVNSESNCASGGTESELDDDDEIQSPCILPRGSPHSRSRVKKSSVQAKDGTVSTFSRRPTRARKN